MCPSKRVKPSVCDWVADPGSNHGLVLLEEVASAVVQFNYCSELGWSPCTLAQAPKLTVWYRP